MKNQLLFLRKLMPFLLLVILNSCSSNDLAQSSFYSDFLGISLPANLKLLHTNTASSDIQDYSAFTVYSLTQSDVKTIISQVQNRLCDTVHHTSGESCWEKYGNYYTFHQSSQDVEQAGFSIQATITNDKWIDTLLIAITKI